MTIIAAAIPFFLGQGIWYSAHVLEERGNITSSEADAQKIIGRMVVFIGTPLTAFLTAAIGFYLRAQNG